MPFFGAEGGGEGKVEIYPLLEACSGGYIYTPELLLLGFLMLLPPLTALCVLKDFEQDSTQFIYLFLMKLRQNQNQTN